MNKVKKAVLRESADGVVYEYENIPSGMFEFYILQRRTYKDGTKNFDIGVSPVSDTSKGFILDRIRGTREDAETLLDKIMSKRRT